jgi:hypothetical protein
MFAIPRPCAFGVLLVCLAAGLAGWSLGGGSSKAGGPASTPVSRQAHVTVTIRFAGAAPWPWQNDFTRELAHASGGSLRAQLVNYDRSVTDLDQRIARDLARGRLDVADVAARA